MCGWAETHPETLLSQAPRSRCHSASTLVLRGGACGTLVALARHHHDAPRRPAIWLICPWSAIQPVTGGANQPRHLTPNALADSGLAVAGAACYALMPQTPIDLGFPAHAQWRSDVVIWKWRARPPLLAQRLGHDAIHLITVASHRHSHRSVGSRRR